MKVKATDIQSTSSSRAQGKKQTFDHFFINEFQVIQIYPCPKSWQIISFKVNKAEKKQNKEGQQKQEDSWGHF